MSVKKVSGSEAGERPGIQGKIHTKNPVHPVNPVKTVMVNNIVHLMGHGI
jgi:hypothetical protein